MSDIYTEVLKEIEKHQWYCEFGKYTYEPVGDMIKNTVYLTDGRVIDFYLFNAIVEIAKENYGEKSYNIIAKNIVGYFTDYIEKENENELQRIGKDDLL